MKKSAAYLLMPLGPVLYVRMDKTLIPGTVLGHKRFFNKWWNVVQLDGDPYLALLPSNRLRLM